MEELEDEDAGDDTAAAEAEARKVFEEMVDTQARLSHHCHFHCHFQCHHGRLTTSFTHRRGWARSRGSPRR